MGEQLAIIGIEHLRQTKVGDNLDRIVDALTEALERADAVIVCGGLGPTQDDITREAIAQVMGVELVRDRAIADVIRHLFESRGRVMAENNLRQADVPGGRDRDRAAHRHRPRAHLPGGGQGRLRRAGRALRDEGDARAGRPARPGRPVRAPPGDRQPRAAHLGRERVPRGGAARPAARGARRGRRADHRLPGQRDRGHQGPPHRPRRHGGRGRGAPARRRGGRGARRARPDSCSAARTCRWRRRSGGSSSPRGSRWPWPSRSPAGCWRLGSSTVPGASDWFTGGVVAYDRRR